VGRSDQAQRVASPLLRLAIEDVGLIARAEVEFAAGFTAFTGETGSGKTMLLGALELALGGRADRELVRGERARVSLELAATAALRAQLEAEGIVLAPDDDVVIVRELSAAGRTSARVNGVPVSATQLRALADAALETIGQGEATRLLEPAFARELLDRFGGAESAALRAAVRARFEERRALVAERDALLDESERAVAERAHARESLAEIEAAAVQSEDEDERLRERRDVLADAERIAEALGRARAALEDEGGVVDALGAAVHALAGLARYGSSFAQLAETASVFQGDANALAQAVARAADDVERDPRELDEVSARLDVLDRLKRKYGGTLATVEAARERFAAAVEGVLGRDEHKAALERALAAVEAALADAVAALRARRLASARACEGRVADELRVLAMPAARFGVAVEPGEVAPHGGDRVEFRFSANPGEPERPLARVASGGERSRLLLAIVVVLAGDGEEQGFVFDEIDAGIGGATAIAVGTRLGTLARRVQVACVTHLAQIAVWADAHYALRKREENGTTTIEVVPLAAGSERTTEIARMLSGDVNAVSLEHASALARDAAHARRSQRGGKA
jgi:DNA repair protein RecN (Recombination protein N)